MLFQAIHRTCGTDSRNHRHKHGKSTSLELNYDSAKHKRH